MWNPFKKKVDPAPADAGKKDPSKNETIEERLEQIGRAHV